MDALIYRRIKEARMSETDRAQALWALAVGEQIARTLMSLGRDVRFVASHLVPAPHLHHKH